MKLPNATKTIIEHDKIVHYLLNAAHPDNGGKARFFATLGFEQADWLQLAAALRVLAETGEVVASTRSRHGQKYVVVGRLVSPRGKSPLVQTIWIVDSGSGSARLITAYPHSP